MSPLPIPRERRRRRERAKRRRRRKRALVAGVGAAALVLALVLATSLSSGGRHDATAASRPAPASAPRPAAPSASPIGLPLARPAFVLSGLGQPQRDVVHLAFAAPPRAGLLFNLSSGQVLWQRNPYKRLRIASLTKMMTALITVERAPAKARVLVTRQAADAGGSKVGVLPVGRDVRLETMLYGLLLPSGNDAADALAQHVSGSINAFVVRMNRQAAALGMGCTRYSSPSGYYDEGNFSCAADLALLAHVDLAQPRLARIVHTLSAALPFPIEGGRVFLYNNNPLLIYHYPGTTGLKTGYTIAAGRCLVATADRDGVRLGVVLLHSPSPGVQASQLLNLGFEDVYHLPPVPAPPLPPGA